MADLQSQPILFTPTFECDDSSRVSTLDKIELTVFFSYLQRVAFFVKFTLSLSGVGLGNQNFTPSVAPLTHSIIILLKRNQWLICTVLIVSHFTFSAICENWRYELKGSILDIHVNNSVSTFEQTENWNSSFDLYNFQHSPVNMSGVDEDGSSR